MTNKTGNNCGILENIPHFIPHFIPHIAFRGCQEIKRKYLEAATSAYGCEAYYTEEEKSELLKWLKTL